MRVSKSVVRNLIIGIIRDLGIPAGNSLHLSSLRREWVNTGLREEDLIDGLVDLCGTMQLRYDDTEGSFIVARPLDLPGPESRWRDLLSELSTSLRSFLLLRGIGQRPRSGPSPVDRRLHAIKNWKIGSKD